MPDISKLTATDKVELIEIKWADEPVKVELARDRITGAAIANVMDTNNPRALAEALAVFLVSWDVTSNGEPWPPTAENLLKLPMSRLVDLMQAISGSGAPSGEASSSFAGG